MIRRTIINILGSALSYLSLLWLRCPPLSKMYCPLIKNGG
jgi:hypothetical protein